MKRIIISALLACVPLLAFAQLPPYQARQAQLLKQQLGLNDAQVAQVFDIQSKTAQQLRADRVHARLLQAEIQEALLPQTVDQPKVDGLVDQAAQTRADMQKALIGARIQLRSIMGDQSFQVYTRLLRDRYRMRAGFFGAPGGPAERPNRARPDHTNRFSPNHSGFGGGTGAPSAPGPRAMAP